MINTDKNQIVYIFIRYIYNILFVIFDLFGLKHYKVFKYKVFLIMFK